MIFRFTKVLLVLQFPGKAKLMAIINNYYDKHLRKVTTSNKQFTLHTHTQKYTKNELFNTKLNKQTHTLAHRQRRRKL